MWIVRFEVKPRTMRDRFPMDMLRYDCCFPESSGDVDRMCDAYELNEDWDGGKIILKSYVSHKSIPVPTTDRWNTYGYDVFELNRRKL